MGPRHRTGDDGTESRLVTRRRLNALILVLAFAGLAVAAVTLRDQVDASAATDPKVGIPAVLAAVISVTAAAWSWSTLAGVDAHSSGRRRSEFYRSQLAKYLPAGALLTAAGQTALASTEAGRTRSMGSLAINAIGVICAGLVWGPVVALTLERHVLLRLALAVAPVGLLLLDRRLAVRVLGRLLGDPEELPSQPAILRSFALSCVNMLATAWAFVWLLSNLDDVTVSPATIGGFALAWVVGFLIVPLPSGVGARELVVLALVPDVSTAGLIAASVLHRLATVVAELVLVLGTSRRQRHSSVP